MAHIRPFAAIRYGADVGADLSDRLAPPYDVLDESAKRRLLRQNPRNIVEIDLPHTPPKQLGPPEAYAHAASTMKAWIASGTLRRDVRPAIYPYEQTFTRGERKFHRRGFFALVKLTPFGIDVIPHEQTYPGPIEDRLHLMQATGAQLSPVFGLYFDPGNKIIDLIFSHVHRPQAHATLDGVRNELWSITDAEVERQVIDAFKGKKIYIADGHHRYTTALHYQRLAEQQAGGKLPDNHPANYALFTLVCADDPGLTVLPTHRLIAGLDRFDIEAFIDKVSPHFNVHRTPLRPDHVDEFARMLRHEGPNSIGIYDGRTKALIVLHLKDHALMRSLEPERSEAWQKLDVAIVQRYLIDEVLQKYFATSTIVRGYTADEHEIGPRVDSGDYQVALILQPTPVRALEQLGRSGEVMPPKSTYFFPKLATGLVIASLEANAEAKGQS
jgi:uncharacterized protein (DUF1015 family)